MVSSRGTTAIREPKRPVHCPSNPNPDWRHRFLLFQFDHLDQSPRYRRLQEASISQGTLVCYRWTMDFSGHPRRNRTSMAREQWNPFLWRQRELVLDSDGVQLRSTMASLLLGLRYRLPRPCHLLDYRIVPRRSI